MLLHPQSPLGCWLPIRRSVRFRLPRFPLAPDLSEIAWPNLPPPLPPLPLSESPPQFPAPALSSAPSDALFRSQHSSSSPRFSPPAHPSAARSSATSCRPKSTLLCRTFLAAAREFLSRSLATSTSCSRRRGLRGSELSAPPATPGHAL